MPWRIAGNGRLSGLGKLRHFRSIAAEIMTPNRQKDYDYVFELYTGSGNIRTHWCIAFMGVYLNASGKQMTYTGFQRIGLRSQ